jgi:3-deoxy-D-manno-octulosonate 8-phosphate phosphatase (KDO 8-P phosphatase)
MDDSVRTALSAVRLVVTDFDGVLTDNQVYVFEDGREAVRCNRADGMGCDLLRRAGIEVVILSTERNPVVTARAGKLGVHVLQDCPDKGRAVAELWRDRGLERSQVLYVGNDVNDLPAIEVVPLTVAPADAHEQVRAVVSLVTRARGGGGVLRELADLLLAASGPRP